ncbi:gustatory and odorant receptor 22 isoform X1 [Cephus cinctus]|uniref:Gustatory and odorant receptor 22 isoform X1 n=1 Tax=Cephus cinctus TaxID=211228 RepID=A0AAJ7RFL0_CEPCN|nr:gustatory and odorant receptor 22 isoform X1 [Cephus cinctus]XP_024940014.1 gustatory and odorant receptor 22 isoform X1 [Cephus cinctus]
MLFYILSMCSTGYTLMLRFRFFNNPDLPFDDYLFNLIFICVAAAHWILLSAALLSAKRIAEYLSTWNEFQRHYHSVTRRRIQLNFKKRATILLMATIIHGIIHPLIQVLLLGTFTFSEATSYEYIIFLQGYLSVFWESQCRSIIMTARGLRESMKKELTTNPLTIRVEQYRILWQHISDVINKFSRASHIIFGCYSMCLYTIVMVSGYCLLSHLLSEREQIFSNKLGGYLVAILFHAMNLFVLCYCSHQMRREVVEFVVEDLTELKVHRLKFNQQKEVFLFLGSISMNDPRLILLGNHTIGMSTISNVCLLPMLLIQYFISLCIKNVYNFVFAVRIHVGDVLPCFTSV